MKPRQLASFRDDSALIAFRYEQTVQAEPPIPLPPPRNPLRTTARLSTTGTVVPITIIPPPVAPPKEEHPFFRSQSSPPLRTDEWKRDSGLAPSSPSATLREEELEDDFVYQKILDDIADAPSVYSGDEQSPSDAPSPILDNTNAAPAPLKLSAVTVTVLPVSPTSTVELPREPLPSPTPTRASSISKRLSLVKTFSIRSVGNKRLRKKTLSVENFDLVKEMEQVTFSDADATASRIQQLSPSNPPPRVARPAPAKEDETARQSQAVDSDFIPITTSIPEDGLWDDFGNLSFSKRGSLMFGGKTDPFALMMAKPGDDRAPPSSDVAESAPAPDPALVAPHAATDAAAAGPRSEPAVAATPSGDAATEEKPPAPTLEEESSLPSIRVVSIDVERESQKVRSLYESGEDLNWQDGGRASYCERLEPTEEVPSDEEENVVSSREAPGPQPDFPFTGEPTVKRSLPAITSPRPGSSSSHRRDKQAQREYEPAGGLEDWEDVDSADVDRYGFISQRRPGSRTGTPEMRSSHLSPRKRNVLTKRPGSAYSSSPQALRPPSRKVSTRSLNTFASELSTASRRSTRSSIRSATNRLPHNRDRRWMDEAGDMLALEPGLGDIAEDAKSGRSAETMRRKEAERTEKWRKMAKVTNKDQEDGHGMEFEFDTKNPKLIERTWKGIPDCWRGAAWHSFLVASAKTWKGTETDQFLMAEFRRLQDVASPDDVQIDLDVPRTINGHIMFRKRYRGGQRLLFRVLHAISLYFPGTGYVQGMASLAATLLCYYDEEKCFVMMVRLWKYRGLERLYQPGFDGLMAALQDFEKSWLAGKDVATKLDELCIDATAYGTRWYLTLFNLSIPFPAQLRVWDVFMLMGECPPETTTPPSSSQADTGDTSGKSKEKEKTKAQLAPKGLDILHATSAALIHALREVLLDSDFENAMKALTSWIPVKDEDLLMKVARAEWRQHQGKKSKA
ncbi:hypothetical protein OQA88_12102 [Cercophora sp. LCS_1]